MGKEVAVGCTQPATKTEQPTKTENPTEQINKGVQSMIRVGQKAPDFTASAYDNGKFTSVKLSDYLGKWVVLCFYPGDFTFV